ncbi:MAG: SMP-30/gluconolactonase/LRE family protein [Acetobacteraceae bacterium]|nr:SMP-30/gluconolactonase/LRE family protein [Acetobacteraceae bacterium]
MSQGTSAAGRADGLRGGGGASRWESTAPIRYPDPDVVVLDPRFQPLVLGNAAIERIATGFRFTEGPAYFGDGRYLLFSDIPNDALLRWDEITGAVAVLRHPAGYPDGNTRDRQGRLITCELGSRTLTRTEHDGTVTVLAAAFEGTRLTGPNDVVVKSDGSIWFSDNGAGIRGNYLGDKAPQEMPFRVYRLDPDSGELRIAVDDMARPNGLCFSPDETRLYVVDTPVTGPKTTRVYDIVDGKAVNGRLFFDASPGFADGIRCDTEGNVWCGFSGGPGQDGVAVFAPDGTLIGRILLPERCANLCFGGRKRNRLFMTASQSVYALYVEAQGNPGG